jgi:hypothetical protein
VALIVAVKVAIIVAILALPSWFAISLGAAHGVALVLVAVAAAVILIVGAFRRRKRAGEMTMLTTETRIETTNASPYLVHLCRHATKIGKHLRRGHMRGGHARPEVLGVEFSDTHGTLDLSWGRCVLDADPEALTVRIEAATEEHLRGIQNIISADLERFGHRDNLTVSWQHASTGQRAGDDGDAEQDAEGGEERQYRHGRPGQST